MHKSPKVYEIVITEVLHMAEADPLLTTARTLLTTKLYSKMDVLEEATHNQTREQTARIATASLGGRSNERQDDRSTGNEMCGTSVCELSVPLGLRNGGCPEDDVGIVKLLGVWLDVEHLRTVHGIKTLHHERAARDL